ncbi:MAG TPA: 6-carboxytetrahydropterin synthase [Methylomirabilota bacterium]|nr:6-carboxytetrahydropterin synthase [Methylomirabilota bacterium]
MSDYRLTRAYHFSAGHRLASAALSDDENARLYGQCFRPHGHNYTVEVTLAGTLDPATGMAGDLGELDRTVERVLLDHVDHYDLSSAVPALDGVITTGENLARAFWDWLAAALPPGRLARVAVVETANNTFEYCGSRSPR